MTFAVACKLTDLQLGSTRQIVVDGRPVALCHSPEGYFALQGICPHRGGPLGEGRLVGTELTCPWHAWTFDVGTGGCLGTPGVVLTRYATRIAGADLEVEIP